MSPAPISLAWAPGERLLVSHGQAPSLNVEAHPPLPLRFLNVFFAGHLMFIDRSTTPPEKSARYRAIILECRDSLNPDEDGEVIRALHHAHSVWHFIEAVFLTDYAMDDRHISEFLAEWYLLNYPEVSEETGKVLDRLGRERPTDNDEEFWKLLLRLAIVGDIGQMRELLFIGKEEDQLEEKFPFRNAGGSPAASEGTPMHDRSTIVSVVRRVIDCAPDVNISSRSDGTWEEWQANCEMWAKSEELHDHGGACLLLGLLSGNIDGIAEACSKWEEMLVACAMYGQYGHAVGGNLRGGISLVANSCASASAVFKASDEIAGGALVEAALGNLSNSIVRMEASLPSSWFSSHLCDLLVNSGHIEDIPAERVSGGGRPVGVREFYFKAFARGLERYRGCWRIAVDYYAACPSHGPALLIDFLSRIPFESPSDPTAEKVLMVCKKKRFHRTARSICEKLGAECLSAQKLGGAMSWFVRGEIISRAQHVSELALTKAEREGADSPAARSLECVVCAVTNLGDEKTREMFDYMRVYCEMQSSLLRISAAKREGTTEILLGEASRFIFSVRRLVGGGGLPRKFWTVVSFEAARVIELYPEALCLFSRVAINELLSALQLATGPHRSLEMMTGLRGRLAFDMSSGMSDEADLFSLSEAESAVQHCRSIFMRSVAARINAE